MQANRVGRRFLKLGSKDEWRAAGRRTPAYKVEDMRERKRAKKRERKQAAR